MGSSSSRAAAGDGTNSPVAFVPAPRSPAAHTQSHTRADAQTGPLADTGVRVVCPRCRAVLMPPAFLFRCPCGQLMTFNASSGSAPGNFAALFAADAGAAPPPAGLAGPRGMSGVPGPDAHVVMRRGLRPGVGMVAPLSPEERILFVLSRLPRDDPHAAFLRYLLQRLPRGPDGRLQMEALDAVAAQLQNELRGAPQAMIDLLPTRKFERSRLPPDAERKEEHVQCMVCLDEYQDGCELRTLPCLHSFHKDCIDPWLHTNRSCPMCKTAIDVDQEELLLQQLASEERARKGAVSTAVAAPAPPRGGSAAAAAASATL